MKIMTISVIMKFLNTMNKFYQKIKTQNEETLALGKNRKPE